MFKKYFFVSQLIFSILLLFYLIYKSEFVWLGKKNDYYFIYYIFSISLISLSLITFILNDKIKEYILIFLISIFIFFYSFEIFLSFDPSINFDHIKYNNKKSNAYKKITGKEFDKRTRLKIYNDLKNKNNDIPVTVTVHPSSYLSLTDLDIFPLSSSSYTKTILCNENGYYNIYESDRYGFNNPDYEWDKNQTEYVLIGDSFVHGSCVNRPNDIASILRSLSQKSVLNLGYEGSGPLIEYATLKEYLKPNMKNIIWFYTEINDVEDFKNELNNKILINYLQSQNFTQDLKNKQDIINELSRSVVYDYFKDKKFNLKKFIKLNNLRLFLYKHIITGKFNPNYKALNVQEPISILEFKELIKKINNLAKQNNSNLYFVYIPSFYRYEDDFIKNNYEFIKSWNKNYNYIKFVLNDLNIPIIDIHKEILKKEKNPLELYPFEMFGHFNEKGYNKVAKFIYTSISR